jgi:broad specificity phosphatase PhoE
MNEHSLIVLCRHGNTFEQGEKVVMVGAAQDLPLTDTGRMQARLVGEALTPLAKDVTTILTGPLLRTSEYGKIVCDVLRSGGCQVQDIRRDERLRELDYGAWSGLSNAEIKERYGEAALEAWVTLGERPTGVGVHFSPSSDVVCSDMMLLMEECARTHRVALIVTSNGVLREVGRVLSGDRLKSWSMKTGNISVLRTHADRYEILAWDRRPEEVATMVAG